MGPKHQSREDHSQTEGCAGDGRSREPSLELAVAPHGPDGHALERAAGVLAAHPLVTQRLAGAEHRLLSVHLADEEGAKPHAPCPADAVTAVVYDYANRRVVEATARLSEIAVGAAAAVEVRERGDEPLPSADEFAHAVDIVRHDRELRARTEIQRPRDPSRHRRWRVRNTATGEAYTLVPGASDGAATPYGVGDLWVLRYHPNEIDDGQGFTTNPSLSRAHLDPFMTPPEPVTDTDVVLWYSAHFTHDQAHEAGAKVGPDLVPSGW
jgi:hypothetical protein